MIIYVSYMKSGYLNNPLYFPILKSNAPSAVILSPEEYKCLSDIEDYYQLLLLGTGTHFKWQP